jgi:tellurite methyltransferase
MTDSRNNGDREPAPFLVENLTLLPRGKALDVAMGRGRNSLLLASQGFEVEGVDIDPAAIEEACRQAETQGLRIKAEVGDLVNGFTLPAHRYDVVICFNYLQRSLIPQIKATLKKGGVLVYETYIADQGKLFGPPHNPDFLLKHNELLKMFADFYVLRYREGLIENRKAIASLVAQKV